MPDPLERRDLRRTVRLIYYLQTEGRVLLPSEFLAQPCRWQFAYEFLVPHYVDLIEHEVRSHKLESGNGQR